MRGLGRTAGLHGLVWAAVAGWVLCAGPSCSLGPSARVRLSLPDPPAHWKEAFPGLTFLVVFPDAAGQTVCVSADQGPWIECSKAANTPILAYPCGVSGEDEAGVPPGLLRPAGAVYPLDLAPGSVTPLLELSWEGGPLALLLSRLRAGGMEVPLLNAGRLRDRLRLEQDPWNLDLDGMARELARGSFSASDVDTLPVRDGLLPVPCGWWFLESPFAAPVDARASGELALPGLSIGLHELFSTNGSWIRLYVQEREITSVRRR